MKFTLAVLLLGLIIRVGVSAQESLRVLAERSDPARHITIHADYQMLERLYAQRAALNPEPIVFTHGGGWVEVKDGRTASVQVNGIVKFPIGTEYIFFFVRRRDGDGHYQLVAGAQTMFVIKEGKASQVDYGGLEEWRKPVPAKSFIDRLYAVISQVERQGRGNK